ncbi:MAG: hypothetical protein P1U87_14315 [Verrucomicrobiales bacterium]|nr:hypothetical protein [Verrucomicrobiales bacterium]
MQSTSGYHSRWIWVVYLCLFVIAVPWYWPADSRQILFGFPLWVVVSIATSFVISCYTAWLFLTRWPEDSEEEGE